MNGIEEKCIQFVFKNYKHGVFDTQKALRKLKGKNNIYMRKRHIRYYWCGVAASLLLCLGTYLYWNMQEDTIWTQLATTDNTMKYMLPDSTSVVLSPHSTISYCSDKFKNGQREVKLTGKAYFDVYHDTRHPFCVTGQYALIKVLGTKFQVNELQSNSTTEVYVSSGKVLFAAKGENDGIILTKKMQARLFSGRHLPQIMQSQTPNPTAWAIGTFIYERTPLSVVLKELSDYYHVRLTTVESDKVLTAEFETDDDLNEIISLIEESLEVKIKRE